MPKMRASSRSTSEGSASPRMAENSRARKSRDLAVSKAPKRMDR